MAELDPSRRAPLSPAWRPGLQSVASVAALFCLMVSAGLMVHQVRMVDTDPLNEPGLVEVRRQFVNAPDDELLKRRIRQEDWRARQVYFSAQGRTRTGAVLLLGGALVLLICLAVMPLTDEPSPDPSRTGSRPAECRRRRSARLGLIIGAAVLAGMVMVLAHGATPDPALDQDQGRAMAARSVQP